MDLDVNGTLFAEAGAWVAICRFLLFPLLTLRRRLAVDAERRTGRRYVPKEATHGVILLATRQRPLIFEAGCGRPSIRKNSSVRD